MAHLFFPFIVVWMPEIRLKMFLYLLVPRDSEIHSDVTFCLNPFSLIFFRDFIIRSIQPVKRKAKIWGRKELARQAVL